MLTDLLGCLLRPRPGAGAACRRQMIADALAMLDTAGPRDRVEATRAVQGVAFHLQAREALRAAMGAGDPEQTWRLPRYGMALQRDEAMRTALIERHRRRHVG